MTSTAVTVTNTLPLHFEVEEEQKYVLGEIQKNNADVQSLQTKPLKKYTPSDHHNTQSRSSRLFPAIGFVSLIMSIIISLCYIQQRFDPFRRSLCIIILSTANMFVKTIQSSIICCVKNDQITKMTSGYIYIILSAIGDTFYHLIQSYILINNTVYEFESNIHFISIIGICLGTAQSFIGLILLFCIRICCVILMFLTLFQQSLGIYIASNILQNNLSLYIIVTALYSIIIILSVIMLCYTDFIKCIFRIFCTKTDSIDDEEQQYHHIILMPNSALITKQNNWTSFYGFEYLTKPIKWFNDICIVFNTYIQSDISNQRTAELCNELLMNSKSRRSFIELFSDYIDFKKSPQFNNMINNDGIQHSLKLAEFEKKAINLHLRANALSENETNEYHELVRKLDHEYDSKQQKIMYRANELYSEIFSDTDSAHILRNAFRNDIEFYVENKYKAKYCNDTDKELEITDYSIIEMIVSKIFMKRMDDELLKERKNYKSVHIAFLIAMADEHNRLNRKYYRNNDGTLIINYTGEDFLNVKLHQLDFIFKNIKIFDWWLIFVDDYPKRPTKDAITMHSCLQRTGKFHHFKYKIIALDYTDLNKFIKLYNDPNIANESRNIFADNSYKGGAIHLGLRYLIHALKDPNVSYRVPEADFIYISDCDISTNLANIGILLHESIHNNSDIVIGSRRLKNSHVFGKPLLRQIQSQIFNLLIRCLLNVQVTDTQVGAKLIKSNVIKLIHKDFKERSMSFDVEILKLALNNNYKIKEEGIIWIDSEMESKSASQSTQMLHGLLNIFRTMYRNNDSDINMNHCIQNKQAFIDKGLMLKHNEFKLLQTVLYLAMNDKFNFVINHLFDVYNSITPKEFRIFMDSFQQFVYDILTSNKDIEILKKEICELTILFKAFVDNVQPTEIINFIFNEFPQIFNILELIYKDFNYIYILSSILFGDDHIISFTKHFGFQSFHDYCCKYKQPYEYEHVIEYYEEWLYNGDNNDPQINRKNGKKHLIFNQKRFENGKTKLIEMNINLSKPVTIGIITMYNQDSTSEEYVDMALTSKLNILSKEYGNLENIQFIVYVIDARLASNNVKLTSYIDEILKEFNDDANHNVYGKHLPYKNTKKCAFTKPSAVRFGLSYAMEQDDCDYIGYIDFSNKIEIREIGNFIYNLYQHKLKTNNDNVIAIGSRRLYESQVVNKPIPYLFRSAMLNILVKTIFPDLFKLSDTQTGFKFFTSSAWQAIIHQDLQCESIVFDVELLQYAINNDIEINELPVDFEDNSQNIHEIQSAVVNNEVIELIKLRGRIKDKQNKNEAILIGSGAENVVYSLPNNDVIIKIPTDIFDADFVGFLKYFVFKKQKEMSLMDQNAKITSSSIFQQILNHPFIHDLIPDLRNWNEFNSFVMKIITSFENKNYKSIGYRIASKLGRDLVVPFKFIDYKFSLTFSRNETKYFYPKHKVKQSVFVHTIFKQEFEDALSSSEKEDIKILSITILINDGILLFYKLWNRGLFDLDTNLMCDTAFYDGSLMILDPGELINDISLININTERNKVYQRYDIMEMQILFKKYSISQDNINTIFNYYKTKIHHFLDFIEKDIHQHDVQLKQFGKDQLEGNLKQFEINLNKECHIDCINNEFDDKQLQIMTNKRNAFLYSSVDYQSPYIDPHANVNDDVLSSNTSVTDNYWYYHLIPCDVVIDDLSPCTHCLYHKKINVEIGSIGPLLSDETLKQMNEFTLNDNDKTIIFMIDAGSATRSGIIKYGGTDNNLNTKGNVHMFNRPIYDYAAQPFVQLIENSHNILKNGYTIVAAADEILYFNEQQMDDIVQYFSGDNAPGLYWCDLPNAGKDVLPMTVCDTYNFIKNETVAPEFIQSILKQIPMLNGLLNHMNVQETYNSIFDIMDMISTQLQSNTTDVSSPSSSSRLFPIIASFLSDYYQQFVQFNAQMKLNGLKTPFFMIFKNSFLKEFKENIIDSGLLPSYTWTDITWKSILTNGIKCDKYIWSKNNGSTGKPSLLSQSNWMKIYQKIQLLKHKYNININGDQNEQRIFKSNWHNFDDPFSILQFALKQSNTFKTFINEEHKIKIVNDNDNNENYSIQIKDEMLDFNDYYNIVILQSNIEGNIIITKKEKTFTTNLLNDYGYNLFYNVDIECGKTIEIYPNHLIVGIRNKLYSMEFGLITKKELKKKIIFEYVQNNQTNVLEPKDTNKTYKQYKF